MSVSTVDVPADVTETAARAALAELIAKHGLPEPADVRWHELNFGTRTIGTLSLTASTREHVTAWAEVMHRKVKTEQKIHVAEYAPDDWICFWDTLVALRNWLPNVRLSVSHHELRHAKTTAAMQVERDELIERVMSYRTPAVAR